MKLIEITRSPPPPLKKKMLGQGKEIYLKSFSQDMEAYVYAIFLICFKKSGLVVILLPKQFVGVFRQTFAVFQFWMIVGHTCLPYLWIG